MSYVFANDRYHDLHGTEGRFHAVLGELVEIGSFEGYTLIIPTGRRKRMLDRMLTVSHRVFLKGLFRRGLIASFPMHIDSCYSKKQWRLLIFHFTED